MRESVQGLARSRAGRDGPFVLFFLGLLGGSAWFAYRLLSGLDFLELLHLIPDDAYYYSQIARNMAAGQFSTFDGGITLTNGYHPAWLFLITPLYWVFDAKEALVAIKGLEIGPAGRRGRVGGSSGPPGPSALDPACVRALGAFSTWGFDRRHGGGGSRLCVRSDVRVPRRLRTECRAVEMAAGRPCLCLALGAAGGPGRFGSGDRNPFLAGNSAFPR